MVHRYILDRKLGRNLFGITLTLVEGKTSIQNQHLIMDQFIYQNPNVQTIEDTSVVYHRQFLRYLLIIWLKMLDIILWLSVQLFVDLVQMNKSVISTFVINQS